MLAENGERGAVVLASVLFQPMQARWLLPLFRSMHTAERE